jgi:outer membrane protein
MFVKKISVSIVILFLSLSVNAQKKWTLKECVDQALQNNVSLNQSELNNEVNKINLEQSKANVLPNLNISDAHAFNYGRSLDPSTYQYTTQNISTNNLSLNSNITVFNGFQNLNSIKQNKVSFDAGNMDIDKLKNDISMNVVVAYMQTLMAYEAIDISKSQLESTTAQVERTKKYVDAGKLAEGNLFQIQSQLASDKLSEINAENQLQLAKVNLMQLMETPVTIDFEIERPEIKEVLIDVSKSAEEIYNIAESARPEVKSAALKTMASEFGYKVSQSLYLPKLTVGGALRTTYSSGRSLYTTQTVYNKQTIGYLQSNPLDGVIGLVPINTVNKQTYSFSNQFKDNFGQVISLNLSIPIFNNLQAKSSSEKAKINLANAKLNEQAVKNQLRKIIEQAYTDQLSAQKKLIATQEQLKAQDRSYRDSEKKYESGLLNATDFIIEKNNLNKSKLALIQAKYDFIFKTKLIDFYLGKPLTL